MRVLRAFLRPSWAKAGLAVALFATFLSTDIQAYAFSPFGPKPKLYDLLSPLGIWPAAVLLFGPVHGLGQLLGGPSGFSAWRLLYYLSGGAYSLLFAWLFMFAHERGGFRIYRPARLTLPFVPVLVLFLLAHTWPDSKALSGASLVVSGLIFTVLVAAAYLYLAFCLGRGLTRSSWWNARWGRPLP